jgi:hypothetical protein
MAETQTVVQEQTQRYMNTSGKDQVFYLDGQKVEVLTQDTILLPVSVGNRYRRYLTPVVAKPN